MIRLANLLMEQRQRSKQLSVDEIIDLYRKNCKEHRFPNQKIYRGIKGADFEYGVVNPSNFKRTSTDQAGGNSYTLLMDNLTSWQDYPKRSRSIICSTSQGQASAYGNVYVVIPFDNATIGVAPDNDIWFSFRKGFELFINSHFSGYSLKIINQSIDFLYQYLKQGKYQESISMISQNDFGSLTSQMKEISENIDLIKKRVQNDYGDRKSAEQIFADGFIKAIQTHNGLYNLMKKVFDPKLNGFKLVQYKSAFKVDLSQSRELWTESKSLLIEVNTYEKFLVELKKRNLR